MTTTTAPTETHLTASHVARFASAYGDTDAKLCDRVAVLADALSYGVDVKTIVADMAAEHRLNRAIPTVSASTLSRARFAITVSEIIGTDLKTWIKRDKTLVANVVRAVADAGSKALGKTIRDAVDGVDGPFSREEIVAGVIEAELARVLPAPETTPRAAASEKDGDTDADGETGAASAARPATLADALAAVRSVTAWLDTEAGEWSADLASAIAELTATASAARKRGAAALATAKRTSVPA